MSGPIVRSGPSEKFTSNWGQAFGDPKPATKKAAPKAKKKAAGKAKKKAVKKS